LHWVPSRWSHARLRCGLRPPFWSSFFLSDKHAHSAAAPLVRPSVLVRCAYVTCACIYADASVCSCIQPLNLMKQLNRAGSLAVTCTIYTFYMYNRCSRNVWRTRTWHPYPYYVSRRRTCTHAATAAAHRPADVHRTNGTGPNASSWSAPIFLK
jgi:hypothetical protein